MEGIAVLFVVVFIVSSIVNAARNASKGSGGSGGGVNPGSANANLPQRPGVYTGSATSEQRARLEQLRRLQQQRQTAAQGMQREGLQREEIQRPQSASGARALDAYAEKPVYPHETEDCGGGSIHDGYHEGTVRRPAPASSAEGRQGKQGSAITEGGVTELYRKDYAKSTAQIPADGSKPAQGVQSARSARAAQGVQPAAAGEESGADRLAKAISGRPAAVQGLIWAEVLGRPLSDN